MLFCFIVYDDIPVWLDIIELGGEVWVGKIADTQDLSITDEDVFKFQGYFGFNPANPMENYAYFRQSGADLTVERFCKVFGITLPDGTPGPLRRSGFYGEQVFSYTNKPGGKIFSAEVVSRG